MSKLYVYDCSWLPPLLRPWCAYRIPTNSISVSSIIKSRAISHAVSPGSWDPLTHSPTDAKNRPRLQNNWRASGPERGQIDFKRWTNGTLFHQSRTSGLRLHLPRSNTVSSSSPQVWYVEEFSILNSDKWLAECYLFFQICNPALWLTSFRVLIEVYLFIHFMYFGALYVMADTRANDNGFESCNRM